jgi:hypothetical protein
MPTDKEILDEATMVTLTTSLVRDGTEEELCNALSDAFDEAQASVFNDDQPYNYVIVKIVKG